MRDFDLIRALDACRQAEREQTFFYRSLAAEAEERGDTALAERFNELHADEQHHLSRLTARMIELGAAPSDLSHLRPQATSMEGWELSARRRERDEVGRYEVLLSNPLDGATEALIRQILDVERHHAMELGGKWTPA